MKKVLLPLICLILCTTTRGYSQCTPTKISSKAQWEVVYFDSEEPTGEGAGNGHAQHAIDGDTTTFWHTQWDAAQPPYPHEIQIDLGDTFDVAGISVLTRYNKPFGKPKAYEIYVSMDTSEWHSAQAIGDFQYPDVNAAAQRSYVFFGAIKGRYVRIRFLSSYGDYYYSVLSEIDVYEDLTCPATGQTNQLASFEPISKKYTSDPPFQLHAETNSGLPISFEIVSGPASVKVDTLILGGTAGTVVVRAYQEGDSTYYPWEATQSFEVVDLSGIKPEIRTRFVGTEDLYMPELSPYLLHAYASIAESNTLDIVSIEYLVDGEKHLATPFRNSYQYWWTPSSYGQNTIKVIATASNGEQSSKTININVSKDISDRTVKTFDGDVINFDGTAASQWFYGEYILPQSVGAYEQILAHFKISCPSVPGGCDDWDRLAYVEVKAPNGDWIELFRYITPYGVPCGQTIDVTDYASVLQGKVEFRMYIETWGTGGWKLDLDLEYVAGEPQYKYSQIEELWQGNYSFGDPANLQPVDTASVKFAPKIVHAKLRLVTTGHGWGENNTSNAAEFYHAVHDIEVNHQQAFIQNLWQDCDPNPANCTGQQGTWWYNRAGWCPGSIGKIYTYDLSPYLNRDSIALNYIFQKSYKDYCHPNNPDCESGITCPNCNDGINPYYRVGAYVIKFSNKPYALTANEYVEARQFAPVIYPNPTLGLFSIHLKEQWHRIDVGIFDVSGRLIKARAFDNTAELNATQFNIRKLQAGIYFIKLRTEGKYTSLRIVKYSE